MRWSLLTRIPLVGLLGLGVTTLAPTAVGPTAAAALQSSRSDVDGQPDDRTATGTSFGAGSVDVTGRHLVQFIDSESHRRASTEFAATGLRPRSVANRSLFVTSIVATPEQAAGLRRRPDVLAVEPDRRIRLPDIAGSPPLETVAGSSGDDVSVTSQQGTGVQANPPWGLDRIDQRGLPLDSSFTYVQRGVGVDLYVLDSGMWLSHDEFAGRVTNSAYWDFYDGTFEWDCNGHGTHVAGTAAGATYGVAKGASIIPVKVFDCDGYTNESILIAGIDWILRDHLGGQPAVVNMSLGGPTSTLLDNAVLALVAEGITVVAAAGNDASNTCFQSPARVPAVITVAASTYDDDDAYFSNYGSCNDIFAPGVDIISAWPGSDRAWQSIDGTSMAAPHVAGAAAMILERNRSHSPGQVWSAINSNATVGALTECCGDPDKLLHIPSWPSAPRSVSGVAGDSEISVSWSAPSDDGGSLVGSYTATASPGGRSCTTSSRSCVITGLTNGVTYTVTVRATNGAGTGPASPPTAPLTPEYVPGMPGAPTSVVGVPGDARISVSWSAPSDDGGFPIFAYIATASPGGRTCTTSEQSCVITGLTNRTTYTVTVRATNSTGTGRASAPSGAVTPFGAAPESVVSTNPGRLLDTRSSSPGRLSSGRTVGLIVTGRNGVPSDADAVWLNVTAVDPWSGGYLTVYPCGSARPNASNVNHGAGQTVANAVLAKVGSDGRVCVYAHSTTHVIVDVNGYVPDGSAVSTLLPSRLLDTRFWPGDRPAAGSTVELSVTARGGVPANADAVLVNVTAVDPWSGGYLTVYPCGTARPNASNVNFAPGQTVANAVLAKVGTNGRICIHTHSSADLVVDVSGYLADGGSLAPLLPARLMETRGFVGATTVDGRFLRIGRRSGGSTTELTVAGRGGVPSTVDAVLVNVTAVDPARGGYLTVYPCGSQRPNASNLNFGPGQTVANAVLAKVGTNGRICIYSPVTTDLVVDVNGYAG